MPRYSNDEYELKTAPVAMVHADLNNDGLEDIAYAHRYGRITVLLNQGGGQLHISQDERLSSRFWDMDAGDLDHDGDIDLVVLNDVKSKILVFRNDGEGGFNTYQPYDTLQNPQQIIIEDLDNDGSSEVVVGSVQRSAIAIYPTNSSGTLGAPEMIQSVEHPKQIVAGDLDADGIKELIVASFIDSQVHVLKKRQPGRWDTTMLLSYSGYCGDLLLSDLDEDTQPELILSRWDDLFSGSIRVYTLDAGAFRLVDEYSSVDRFGNLAAADIDGDGRRELVGSSPQGDFVRIFGYDPAPRLVPAQRLLTDPGPGLLSLIDLDLDGDPDLVTTIQTSGNEHAQVNENIGDGAFASRVPIRDVPPTQSQPLNIDLNGDGLNDLAWSSQDTLNISLAISPSEYAPTQSIHITGDLNVPTAMDLDQDGLPELIVSASETRTLTIVWNDPVEPFTEHSEYLVAGRYTQLSPADFDLDGDIDLAVTNSWDSYLSYLSNEGSRHFELSEFDGIDRFARAPAISDLDGDGAPDIATVYESQLRLIRNDGQGEFDTSEVFKLPFPGDSINSGDFDGDGLDDLFIFSFDEFVFLFNDGRGGYNYEPDEFASFLPYSTVGCKVKDLDQDGDLDIMVYGGETARVLTNTGFGDFRIGTQFETGMWIFDLIDFDGDGDLDIEGADFSPPAIMRLSNLFEPGCIADTTLDGALTFDDVTLYMRLYTAGRAAADLDRNGTLDASDIMLFVEQYRSGCID